MQWLGLGLKLLLSWWQQAMHRSPSCCAEQQQVSGDANQACVRMGAAAFLAQAYSPKAPKWRAVLQTARRRGA